MKKKFLKRMDNCFKCGDSLLKIHYSKSISHEELMLLKNLQIKEFREVCKQANSLKLKKVKIGENIDKWLETKGRTSGDYRRTYTIRQDCYYFFVWEKFEEYSKILVRGKHPDYTLYFEEIPNIYLTTL